MSMKINQFTTSDFYSAVILRASNLPLIDLIRENPKSRKATFVFSTENTTLSPNDILQDYWNGDLMVNAKSFIEAINEIKTRLYDVR